MLSNRVSKRINNLFGSEVISEPDKFEIGPDEDDGLCLVGVDDPVQYLRREELKSSIFGLLMKRNISYSAQ